MRIGSGTNLKLVEYLANHVPTVSTPFGARGLPVESGRHLLLAEPEDFADAVEQVLADPASADRLAAWVASAGWQRLLNRQGTTWRKLDAATQAAVTDAASAQALMLAQASVVKRPVVEWPDGSITVGFDEADFARRL